MEAPESYKQALGELDALLKELEGDRVDIDGLVQRVERGAFLLKHCQAKLSQTEVRIKEILASLDEEKEAIQEAKD